MEKIMYAISTFLVYCGCILMIVKISSETSNLFVIGSTFLAGGLLVHLITIILSDDFFK